MQDGSPVVTLVFPVVVPVAPSVAVPSLSCCVVTGVVGSVLVVGVGSMVVSPSPELDELPSPASLPGLRSLQAVSEEMRAREVRQRESLRRVIGAFSGRKDQVRQGQRGVSRPAPQTRALVTAVARRARRTRWNEDEVVQPDPGDMQVRRETGRLAPASSLG
jgi:hypothetical protein